MPSFADIKSHALKAKDTAADKFNNAKDRYQVSTSSCQPPRSMLLRLHDSLTMDTWCRTVLPRTLILGRNHPLPRHLRGHQTIHLQTLRDRNLIRAVLLPRLYEPNVLMHLHNHPRPPYLPYLQNLQPQYFLHHQRGDSTSLKNQPQTPNLMRIQLIGPTFRTRISKSSLAG